MTTVYLIRHGWSEGNQRQVYCGWTDLKLTPEGIEQVKTLASTPLDPLPTRIISSDLSRASDTATILAEAWQSTVYKDSDFREMNFGVFENRTYDNIIAKYPSLAEDWRKDWYRSAAPGGESLEEVYERAISAYRMYVQKYWGTCWGIVAHGGILQAILAMEVAKTHEGHWHFSVENAKLTRLDYTEDGFAVLKVLNR